MQEALKIFIGWDPREAEAAEVCRWSIERNASIPVEIRMLKKSSLIEHSGFDRLRTDDRPGATEFAYTRFAVPYLCGYEGVALFMDSDMVVFADVAELAELSMENYALRVVQQRQIVSHGRKMDGVVQRYFPRKNWSSFMLMNCEKLDLWSKTAVETWTGSRLHRFDGVPDERIGALDPNWNVLNYWDPHVKCWHLTSGGPWFEENANCPFAGLWVEMCREYRREKGIDGPISHHISGISSRH